MILISFLLVNYRLEEHYLVIWSIDLTQFLGINVSTAVVQLRFYSIFNGDCSVFSMEPALHLQFGETVN